jgi:KipI family sensor histidine kinase inhibitor
VLLETDEVLGWYVALTDRPLPGQVDLVPAAETLLVRFESTVDLSALSDRSPAPVDAVPGDPVTIPVRYDGADLAEVARLTSLAAEDVVAVHSGAEYVVGFTGFAPGFGYLTGLDERLHLPRRDSPRTRVPAGAVAVAGEYTGVYPRPSPGGWHLLGTTSVPLWDSTREPPALLLPGTRVRFAAVTSLPSPTGPARAIAPVAPDGIEVVHCGPSGTVQDTGRRGYARIGVGRSGAADARAAALANRLVGNTEAAALLELSFGATLTFRATTRVAVTGASCALSNGGRDETLNAPFVVAAGESLVVGPATVGLRTYVAVRGGVDVPPELGSRSTDVLSGLGPAPLTAGTVLPVGTATTGPPPPVEVAPVAPVQDGDLTVRVLSGPRDDWFTGDALDTVTREPYVVTAESNRVGVRLSGPRLARSRDGELPSEGMVAGSVQVPPGGDPIVFLADHPVTGGYPVIAVVCEADLPVLAQARPGQRVRFTRSGTPRRSGAGSRRGT